MQSFIVIYINDNKALILITKFKSSDKSITEILWLVIFSDW